MSYGPFGDFRLPGSWEMPFDQRVEMAARRQLHAEFRGQHPPRRGEGGAYAIRREQCRATADGKHEGATRTEHPERLAGRGRRIGQMSPRVERDDAVECRFGEGKCLGISLDEADAVGEARVFGLLPREGQHFGR